MQKQTEEFINYYFPEVEGELIQIFGKPKNGKTALATKLAWDYLMQGYTVACNWKIEWNGYDERQSKFKNFLGILGFKKYFAKIPKENFVFLEPSNERLLLDLRNKTDLIVMLDEGHNYVDSYKKTDMSLEQRNIALFTGHFNRKIIVISQRFTAIHASVRDCVNKFFFVEKESFLFFWVQFHVKVFVPLMGEIPNLEEPDEEFTIMGSKSLWQKYNYKSMRGNIPRSQPNYAQVFHLTWKERIANLFGKQFREIAKNKIMDTPPLVEEKVNEKNENLYQQLKRNNSKEYLHSEKLQK